MHLIGLVNLDRSDVRWKNSVISCVFFMTECSMDVCLRLFLECQSEP